MANDRIKLSINNFIEIIILCSIIYIQYNKICNSGYVIINGLIDSIKKSISFASLDMLKYTNFQNIMYNLVAILQGVTSFALVVLSITSYMSGEKSNSNFSKRRNRR